MSTRLKDALIPRLPDDFAGALIALAKLLKPLKLQTEDILALSPFQPKIPAWARGLTGIRIDTEVCVSVDADALERLAQRVGGELHAEPRGDGIFLELKHAGFTFQGFRRASS